MEFNGIERYGRLPSKAKFHSWIFFIFYQLIALLAAPLKMKLKGETTSLEGFGKINSIDGKLYTI